jgi:hypothetical protein
MNEWRLLNDIVLILKNQWPWKHTENTEYSQIISVSSVDSVAIYHDFDLCKRHSGMNRLPSLVALRNAAATGKLGRYLAAQFGHRLAGGDDHGLVALARRCLAYQRFVQSGLLIT